MAVLALLGGGHRCLNCGQRSSPKPGKRKWQVMGLWRGPMLREYSRMDDDLRDELTRAGVVASCGPLPSSQQPVQSSNPSVIYNYRSDLGTASG
jgi:hypothetical protein